MKKETGVNSSCRFVPAVGASAGLLEAAVCRFCLSEILSHRIIWSFFFMLMILSFMGRMVSFWEECKRLWADKSRGTLLALASFLLRQTGVSSSGR
ncbi:MAG: hypothetical protein ACLUIQ_05445 [Dialister invisus]